MKRLIVFVFLLKVFSATGQSKEEKEIIARTYLLSQTVFSTKDSVALEGLFAGRASYGHSHGNVQTREQAIAGIVHNLSTFTDTAISNISVIFADDDVSIVRYIFKAMENTKDGKAVPLNLNIMLVWVKEKGKWKLFGRQAVSLQ